jgi:hypothetical protein
LQAHDMAYRAHRAENASDKWTLPSLPFLIKLGVKWSQKTS